MKRKAQWPEHVTGQLEQQVDALITAALEEDGPDHTSEATVAASTVTTAELRVQESAVICGLNIAHQCFHRLDTELEWDGYVGDGEKVEGGQLLVRLRGRAHGLLRAERPALNILQHLSGIATHTRRCIERLAGYHTKLYDTRKTLPGWRHLQKFAVRVGGGHNHRFGLNDTVMIKDNHIAAAGSITAAVERVRHDPHCNGLPLEVEVESEQQLAEVIELDVDRIMLDNFSVDRVAEVIKHYNGRCEFEVSGGIAEEQLVDYAATGVDLISMGSLTHSVRSIAIHLEFEGLER